jgi:large subunit ribosomal protein L25
VRFHSNRANPHTRVAGASDSGDGSYRRGSLAAKSDGFKLYHYRDLLGLEDQPPERHNKWFPRGESLGAGVSAGTPDFQSDRATMAELLHVEKRKSFGKRNNERLRRAGRLPAILYGHGEEAVSLTLAADQFEASLRHGAKVVDLDGDANGKALLQDVQWDAFLQQVLHVDLLRVRAGEMVKIDVPIELRGESPGVLNGGVIEQVIHSIEIEVALDVIPDKLHISIKNLQIDGHLTAKDIFDLPAGAKILSDEDAMIVHCILPVTEEEPAAAEEGATAEPEVIGKGKEEEEEEAEEKE